MGRGSPPVAPSYFAKDFPALTDANWGYRVGGFGGLRRGAKLHHTPVIFVHGNQVDAQNWLDVMLEFQNLAGYSMQEMYALSYNGLENYYAGATVTTPPTSLDAAYIEQNPNVLANGGHGANDDDEIADLCQFVLAVQAYTGSTKVDIVSHSLGVTIVRRFMELYPALAKNVVAFVGIAGANHGTTVCRGLDTTYYGCNEIAPGTAWLASLNAYGETYGPTRWMTVYNGTEGDPLFVGPDVGSPFLAGADNRRFPGAYHNDLRVGPAEVDTYLPFLLRFGQAGPGADGNGPAEASAIEQAQPNGLYGTLCGVPALTGC
jgi:pimeloyl-ACP methyl ester carboxylesterase